MMSTLYEKIALLPPSMLASVEHFVDSLPPMDSTENGDDWEMPFYGKSGKPIHPQPGCMKDVIVMNDNFFEPDDDWKEYM